MLLKNKLSNLFDQLLNEGVSFVSIRKASMARFEDLGFPTKSDEEWKYSNLLPIINKNYTLEKTGGEISGESLSQYILTNTETYFLVFINGELSKELSTLKDEEVVINSLKNTAKDDLVKEFWNNCVPKEADSLVSMNTALADEGAFIYVPKNTVLDKPIQIVYATNQEGEDIFSLSRALIVIDENAQAQITERHQNFGDHNVFTNSVTEIIVKQNGILDFYKVQNDKESCNLIDNTWVKQDKNSCCTVDTFSFGGNFIRNNLAFLSLGNHSESNMNGITLIGGNQLVDHHTFVDHDALACNSNELYKGIFNDRSKGVFNGKVMVRPGAQKTNAFQANNNLLLTDFASIDTKPQLEIYADDVACSHGCTIGQIDEEALFYLRSRGIPEKEARAMLMYAFANDVIENVKIPELKEKINCIIAEKLGVTINTKP